MLLFLIIQSGICTSNQEVFKEGTAKNNDNRFHKFGNLSGSLKIPKSIERIKDYTSYICTGRESGFCGTALEYCSNFSRSLKIPNAIKSMGGFAIIKK